VQPVTIAFPCSASLSVMPWRALALLCYTHRPPDLVCPGTNPSLYHLANVSQYRPSPRFSLHINTANRASTATTCRIRVFAPSQPAAPASLALVCDSRLPNHEQPSCLHPRRTRILLQRNVSKPANKNRVMLIFVILLQSLES